jgi:hypothetical protein
VGGGGREDDGEDDQSAATSAIATTTIANIPHGHRERSRRTFEHRMGRSVSPSARDET